MDPRLKEAIDLGKATKIIRSIKDDEIRREYLKKVEIWCNTRFFEFVKDMVSFEKNTFTLGKYSGYSEKYIPGYEDLISVEDMIPFLEKIDGIKVVKETDSSPYYMRHNYLTIQILK